MQGRGVDQGELGTSGPQAAGEGKQLLRVFSTKLRLTSSTGKKLCTPFAAARRRASRRVTDAAGGARGYSFVACLRRCHALARLSR